MKYKIILAITLSTASTCFAAERIYSCIGQTPLVSGGVIRVNIINSNGQLKATLSEGASNHNTWDTYHISEQSGAYSGTDRAGREFEVRMSGTEGALVKAVAPSLNSSSGEIELGNISLSCK